MNIERFTIPVDHPCLPGHFPHRPVVPAVVILDEVLAAVGRHYRGRVATLSRCKFVHSLAPGAVCEVTLESGDEKTVRFRCTHAGTLLARGQLGLTPHPDE